MNMRSTFLKPLMLAFLCFLLIPVLLLAAYIGYTQHAGRTVDLAVLLPLAGGGFAAGYFGFVRVAKAFRRRFQTILSGMNEMLEGERRQLQSNIAITSADEFGKLGEAFNDLQAYIAEKYAGVERELQLAYAIQNNLLPTGVREIGGFRIAAACRQTIEVGGDLCDIVQLADGKVAVIVGDVAGKGMQAALIMSAAMALFRREVRKGGTAGEVLTGLNRMVFRALQGRSYVTAGLAILDTGKGVVEYAGAGHLSPYMLRGDALEEVEMPSLPLGIVGEAAYRNRHIELPPGSKLFMLTDGMIEAEAADGEMIGFERFEILLGELSPDWPIERQAEALMEWTATARGSGRTDDRTIVIIESRTPSPLL